MMINTAKKLIEGAEFCHKTRTFREADKINSSLKKCGCRKDTFVQKFFANFTLCLVVWDASFHLNLLCHYVVDEFHLEVSALWMEQVLTIFWNPSLSGFFKNRATFKLSPKELHIGGNVTTCHEARKNNWQRKSGLLKLELRALY